MDQFIRLGRVLFGMSLLGLAAMHFVMQEFVTGRAPAWPASVPGGTLWAYVSGAVLMAVAIAVLARRRARSGLLLAGTMVLLWACLRHVPILAGSSFPSGAWTDAGKAVRFIAGALVLAAIMPIEHARRGPPWTMANGRAGFVVIGRVLLGLTLVLNGYQHFVFTEFVAALVPDWFPGDPVFWTYFGGVTLITGGLGLLLARTAKWAALLSGVMVLSWFFIIHVAREIAGVADGIAVYEALATASIAFVIAGFLSEEEKGGDPATDGRTGQRQSEMRASPSSIMLVEKAPYPNRRPGSGGWS
jgi:uncharacterized membrane protein